MSKMTDEQIKKALENKKEEMICAMVDENRKTHFITNEVVLDLINRQQAEIERLNAENILATSERNAFQKSFYAIVRENRQLKADLKEIGIEYERLDDEVTNGIEVCHECHEKYDKKIKQTKAEAIKELADRLKKQFKCGDDISYDEWLVHYEIDDLVKEMVGEGK